MGFLCGSLRNSWPSLWPDEGGPGMLRRAAVCPAYSRWSMDLNSGLWGCRYHVGAHAAHLTKFQEGQTQSQKQNSIPTAEDGVTNNSPSEPSAGPHGLWVHLFCLRRCPRHFHLSFLTTFSLLFVFLAMVMTLLPISPAQSLLLSQCPCSVQNWFTFVLFLSLLHVLIYLKLFGSPILVLVLVMALVPSSWLEWAGWRTESRFCGVRPGGLEFCLWEPDFSIPSLTGLVSLWQAYLGRISLWLRKPGEDCNGELGKRDR